jgi:flavin reductase (DIM6/NTAB) family NADH-FMN oxidoreductase RutF
VKKMRPDIQSFCYPMPVVLVGVNVAGRPTYLVAAHFSMVNSSPPYLAVSLNKTRHTIRGIDENGVFSVNVPTAAMVEVTDHCGVVSGDEEDKGMLFEAFYGELKTAPMIKDCPFTAECRVVQTADLPANRLFIGEIVAVYSDERYLTHNLPDMRKVSPLILSMPERKYFTLGPVLSRAWRPQSAA